MNDPFDAYLPSLVRFIIGAILFFGGISVFWFGTASWQVIIAWIGAVVGFALVFQALIMWSMLI